MSEIADRIRALCKQRGITIKRFEQDCGFGNGYVRTVERQNSIPGSERLATIASYFKVSESYLLGKEETRNIGNGVLIPLLGRVAAGVPITAVENIIGQEEISSLVARTGDFFALRISGDSMMPYIMNGDVVIVRQQNDAESGDIVVALVNGDDGVCKKLKKMQNGVMLISINSNYEPLVYTTAEIDTMPVTILGKVIEIRRTL